MAQPFTGASLAWLKMRSDMAERFMRIDARGFHQGQEPTCSINRPDTLTQNGLH